MTDNETNKTVNVFTFPPHNIGDTIKIDTINFTNKSEVNSYYNNLTINKDLFSTKTTIRENSGSEFNIYHDFYASVSVNRDTNSLVVGLDYSLIIATTCLGILALCFFYRKRLFRSK